MAQRFLGEYGRYLNKVTKSEVSQQVSELGSIYKCKFLKKAKWQERVLKGTKIKLPMEFLE